MNTTFWDTAAWHRYEELYGDVVGTRARLLRAGLWQTQIIDLAQPQEVLWRGTRKSYHATINRLSRQYLPYDEWAGKADHLRVLASGPGASSLIEMAQHVHLLEAGRVTRPSATWQVMGEWLDGGHALLAMILDYLTVESGQGPCLAYAYFAVHDTWAYYFSAASLIRNVNLALIWWALLWLKDAGVTSLEMGWQGHATDDKGRNIEFTRRGFGGTAVPVHSLMGNDD